ncbi:putative nitrogen assimilation transcription factor nirA [Cercophora samala]|uniref:Nitrogen assimilation transcription factor nirA n=1 Tax=Cercophora samala TaxID=330535 RepID=A0AA40D3H4_9PEZI|nr:putative nitrogen assimilation transcription factor nirA [Cercophora samala]
MDKPPPRPLLPAPPQSESRAALRTPPTGTPLPPRRSAAIAACELCREKKAKCDSRRPSCGRCLSNGVPCNYTTKINETLTQADKREKAQYKKERDDLLHLLVSIRDKPEREAENIFARLRVFNDPFEVCQSLKDAELMPFVSSGPADLLSPTDANEVINLHVPARPWTTLVNDAVVSRLVSRFFSPCAQLLPAIDRDVFVADMQAKNPTTSKLCSPLLVNAVCAVPCFELASSTSLVELFLSQAKSILEREHGRPSLPTALALYLLYLITTLLGRDRAGLHFRRMSLDMLEYLDLESTMKRLRDDIPAQALERRVLSKVLWGVFVAESRTFLIYNRPPLVRPPTVPRPLQFDAPSQTSPDVDDAADEAVTHTSQEMDRTSTDVLCSLAEIQYNIAMHEAEQVTGVFSGEDIVARQSILLKWRELRDWFSNQLQGDTNSSLSSCYVR